MTDVWKSNARKYCEICKVWFADNPVTIQHHESGQRHKAAVKAKLRELGKQNRDREKEKSSLHSTLAKMEAAALRSMAMESKNSKNLPCDVVGPTLRPHTFLDPRAYNSKIEKMAKEMARQRTSRFEMTRPTEEDDNDAEKLLAPTVKTEKVWVEVKMQEGPSYFFHMYSGETTWTIPDSFYTAEEYAQIYPQINASDDYQYQDINSQNHDKDEQIDSHPETVPQPNKEELEPGTIENVSPNYLKQEPKSPEAESVKEPKLPEVEFVKTEQETELLCDVGSIPLPSSEVDASTSCPVQFSIKSNFSIKPFESKFNALTEPVMESESENLAENKPTSDSREQNRDSKKLRIDADSPYGPWVPVTAPVEKPKVDLQLPPESVKVKSSLEALKDEEAVEFSERVVTFRKRKDNPKPVEFKKRKINPNLRLRSA